MKFSDRILNRVKSSSKTFPLLKNWIAQNPSLEPATVNKSWLPHYRTAREAKMILFLGLFVVPWETWEIVARIRDSAYYQRYEGGWGQVQDILEQVTDLSSFEESWLNFSSYDDFFGNFLRECEDFLRRNRFVFKPVERDRSEPRKQVYRRGYRDKGSMRPFHQRGRNLGESSPGEDRRRKISYGNLPDI